jgi:ABC-2 type transport system ATP-binding protein
MNEQELPARRDCRKRGKKNVKGGQGSGLKSGLRYRYAMAMDLVVRDLSKSYRSVTAVQGVSLEVGHREVFGLLGPNGAGKTTTLECILGLRRPDSGSIQIDGVDALAHPEQAKRLVGAQLQAMALQDKITPREALKFFGAFYRNAIKPDELIERFSLREKANATFDSLSAGQKQRLALALAFVNDPKLIFLDEPTAGLDPQSRRELHEDIAKLKSSGRTIVLSTHYIEEAERLCDRIAIISGGKITATGTPAELIAMAKLPDQVIVKTEPMLVVGSVAGEVEVIDGGLRIATTDVSSLVIALVKAIESQGVKLIDLQIRRASLEDAFLVLS